MLLMNCFYCIFILYIAGVGVNPGEQTVYHMCKTWLQKVHGGWDTVGDFEIKYTNKVNLFSLFYFMSKMSKIQCT